SWAAAVTLGDSAGAARWRDRASDSMRMNFAQKLVKISLHSVTVGFPLTDARWANETLRRDGATAQERTAAWLGERAVAFAEGRLVSFGGPGLEDNAWGTFNIVQQAVVEPPYRPEARAFLARGVRARSQFPTGGVAVDWPPSRDCFGELFRVTTGDTSATRQAIRRLREFATLAAPPVAPDLWRPLEFRVCPLLLETLLEGGRDRSATSRLEALDRLMQDGPRWLSLGPPTAPTVAANWTIARLREAQGDIPAALAAIRRRESNYYPAYLWTLPAFLRQEGRLAALAGDTAGARRAYDHYLTLRTDPDPPFQPQRDSVLAERTALGSR
ncbi:MAG TPA: hypothetical protein VLD58_07750, partial [Gemmatimonadales bacterium]|nr:hypothetical protein [Gemmatimonadales bacterium]